MAEAYYGVKAHPACNTRWGHTCQEPTGRNCIIIGCELEAGTRWGPYWCPDHDAFRIDRIDREMAKIKAEVEAGKADDGQLDPWTCQGVNKNGKHCQRKGRTTTGGTFFCHTHKDQA